MSKKYTEPPPGFLSIFWTWMIFLIVLGIVAILSFSGAFMPIDNPGAQVNGYPPPVVVTVTATETIEPLPTVTATQEPTEAEQGPRAPDWCGGVAACGVTPVPLGGGGH